jgi:hypothetical protein
MFSKVDTSLKLDPDRAETRTAGFSSLAVCSQAPSCINGPELVEQLQGPVINETPVLPNLVGSKLSAIEAVSFSLKTLKDCEQNLWCIETKRRYLKAFSSNRTQH